MYKVIVFFFRLSKGFGLLSVINKRFIVFGILIETYFYQCQTKVKELLEYEEVYYRLVSGKSCLCERTE